jgi:hypothetical protein
MKKIILTTIAVTALATSAFSQGLINFATSSVAANRISTNSVPGGALTGATTAVANSYYFALFASSTLTSVGGVTTAQSGATGTYVFNNLGTGVPSGGWELVGIGGSLATLGRMGPLSQGTSSASQGALNTDGSMTVQGIAAGGSANLVAIGWSANIGSTLQSVIGWFNGGYATQGWIGQSAVAVGAVLGDGGGIPTPLAMGTGTGQFSGYGLGVTPVPEPSTMALAALGGASLLLFRRRK